ncbi:MAG: 16S rRNA (guanine(527)-N(7))-methyltransferase RsmG [Ardenticatenaceae bacterium]|nr:16S rRNA (guanine(527)-N(7))-methyltransferase RsmG [Anaerolineales bacterium]MCB8940658.1 16S rRNA (guanine(527)-N(7))-methyltransferase RsmG [Ardenticatenaceae bacterium]MCB8971988.1 16S rRNA (guanine(527)-N(7))-methyltransferase RsmG [Ardenticatenaceae bacterium]
MTQLTEWKQFADLAASLGASLTSEQVDQFALYQQLLLDWNERMNLTAVRDPAEIRVRHFLDSLSCARVMGDLNGRSLVDVGTGAGFPGLPLKILFPQLRLTLVESVAKKGQFLQAVVDALALDEVRILAERAEVLGQQPQHRQQYDWGVARAVAELRVLVEYLLPLCRVGGTMLAQKGEGVHEELKSAATAVRILGGSEPILADVALPEREQLHYFVTIKKVEDTPTKYPRRVGMPGKRPL